MKTKLLTTRNMVYIAMLAAVGTVLYFIAEIPIIPSASWLKVDFATIPAIIGAVIISPMAGVIIVLLQNIIHLFKTTSVGIGELINFIVGSGIVLSFALTLKLSRKRLNLLVSSVIAAAVTVAVTVVVGLLANVALFPFYMFIMGNPQLPAAAFISYLISTIPMNLVKALINVLPVAFVIKQLEKFSVKQNDVK